MGRNPWNMSQKTWQYLQGIRGWHTKRKIVVITSDDWGSIRMPSREVYNRCLRKGYQLEKTLYERFDTLASQDDIFLLFELLSSFKDYYGNPASITANCVVANPDFARIEADGFQHYYYELITETFKHYPCHSKNFELWKEGLENKIFFPQYHAREHLNVSLFMNALRNGDENVHFSFQNNMPGIILPGALNTSNIYVEALRYRSLQDKAEKISIYLEGLDLFCKIFGYRSLTITPPNYTWSPDFDYDVYAKGVIGIQSTRKLREPLYTNKYIYHSHYMGERNEFGQVYLLRNALFEPTIPDYKLKDPVDRCLSDMSIAFSMNRPVIICSHRINYVGFLDQSNRDRTLSMLKIILKRALQKWPDIEFLNAGQLINEIITKNKLSR